MTLDAMPSKGTLKDFLNATNKRFGTIQANFPAKGLLLHATRAKRMSSVKKCGVAHPESGYFYLPSSPSCNDCEQLMFSLAVALYHSVSLKSISDMQIQSQDILSWLKENPEQLPVLFFALGNKENRPNHKEYHSTIPSLEISSFPYFSVEECGHIDRRDLVLNIQISTDEIEGSYEPELLHFDESDFVRRHGSFRFFDNQVSDANDHGPITDFDTRIANFCFQVAADIVLPRLNAAKFQSCTDALESKNRNDLANSLRKSDYEA